MKVNRIKNLFAVAFVGAALAMTGCTTVSEVEEPKAEQAVELPQITPKTQVEAAVETNIENMTLEELKAFAAGKVVNFEFDRSEITQDDFETIRANALIMTKDTNATVAIGGHCDERGSREYNLALGERRGNAVRDALIAEGIAASRIEVISYGEDSPVDSAHNEAAWAKNRRAEFNY
ncbi:peptidoglycan-associated lipoprotein Pal [Thiomicrorhabdus indica]|uniref:peptidoglycan-associated lipoprotein Pal n=1 Tax=Thiomicrorhabdus indica TaxID=2267253 RepID=UPI00102DFCCD|nr:peptidoglycan-associated lipoprotein Pal [Thiomicrorhabdus indica]